MEDERRTLKIVSGGALVVMCYLHGDKYMTGSPDVTKDAPKLYKLGHGRTYVDLGAVTCTACPDQAWLHLEFIEPEETEVDWDDLGRAMLAAFRSENPDEEDTKADEEPEAPAPATSPTLPPPSMKFTRKIGGA